MWASFLILSVISVTTFQHLAAEARKERFNAEVLDQGQDKAIALLKPFSTHMLNMQQRGQDKELLLVLWVMEWFYGNVILGTTEGESDYLVTQINVVRSLHAKAEPGLETKIWETALGFWLIRSGDYEESEPLLEENLRAWEAILASDDPWLDHIRALQACAAISRLADPDREVADLEASRRELMERRESLEQADKAFKKSIAGSPIHLLVIRKLIVLYGPELLDEPRKRRAVIRRLKAFLN